MGRPRHTVPVPFAHPWLPGTQEHVHYSLNQRDTRPETVLANLLVLKGLQEQKLLQVEERDHYGDITPIVQTFLDTGAILVSREGAQCDEGTWLVLAWYERATYDTVRIGRRWTALRLVSLETDFLTGLMRTVDPLLVTDEPLTGTVKMLCEDHGSLYLTALGDIHQALQHANYAPAIVAGFEWIVTNLAAETPQGRLYVLYGPPGSGKSYFLRGVMTRCPAVYIYVPQSVVGRLTSPALFPVLLRERDRDDTLPLCLIMEDADSSLVQRAMDNASVVADMLNMSDGFLGELANLHIFATVNAKKTDIDPALLRPGRLGVYLEFQPLAHSQARNVFTALCAGAQVELSAPAYTSARAALRALYERPHKQATLADVYALARQAGWTPPSRPKPPYPWSRRRAAREDEEAG